jgi:hypothetical protein
MARRILTRRRLVSLLQTNATERSLLAAALLGAVPQCSPARQTNESLKTNPLQQSGFISKYEEMA